MKLRSALWMPTYMSWRGAAAGGLAGEGVAAGFVARSGAQMAAVMARLLWLSWQAERCVPP
jgi:hypothetical protein